MLELWVEIQNYENLYQVSNLGRVRRICKGGNRKFLKVLPNPNGYLHVCLSKEGRVKTLDVHRLVAEIFVPNINNKPEINHKDGIKNHNEATNLEWATSLENSIHKMCVLGKNIKDETNKNAKLGNNQVERIKYLLNKGTLTQKEIAKMFNVHPATISLIKLRKLWAHIL